MGSSHFPDFDYEDVAFKRKKVNQDIWSDVSAMRASEAWKHYLYNSDTKQAKCNHCFELLAAGHGTKGMIQHLSGKHSIHVRKLIIAKNTMYSMNRD